MSKIKVLHMIDAISGGGAMVMYNIIKGLPQYDHLILTPGNVKSWSIGLPKLIAEDNISIQIVTGAKHAKVMDRLVKQRVMMYDPDIVINHWWRSSRIQRLNKFGRTRKVYGRAKTILVSHNNDPSPPGYDYYVSVSKHNAKYQVHANKARKGLLNNHRVIYNGIDVERFNQPRRRRLNADKFVIGRISSLVKFKVPRDWIKFANTFDIPNAKHIIVGQGERWRQFNFDISKLGIPHKFELPGEISQIGDELPKMLAGFDIVCYVTEKTEAFSLAMLEAMSAGKPIVTQNAGGMPEQVVHGQTGFLCNSRQEIRHYCEWLYNNPQQCIIMGKNAQKAAKQKFTIETMAAQYDQLFQELLNG